jgi:hypothetical protein
MHEKVSLLEQHIRELAMFLPQHQEMSLEQFDYQLRHKLVVIEALSQSQPRLRDLYRKHCFDLCAYELDRSFIFRRLRYKPLGYGGDFEVMNALSRLGDSFWDQFLHYQEMSKVFQTHSPSSLLPPVSPILLISPTYRSLELNTYEQVAILEPEPKALPFIKEQLGPVQVYESLDLAQSFGFIYAPYLLHGISEDALGKVFAKIWPRLRENSRILLYQLHSSHSLRLFFEWCLDWNLHYHPENKLKQLAQSLDADYKLELEGEWWRLELHKGM